MMADPIQRRLDERRALLMWRCERIAAGEDEGAAAEVALELIADEMEHLLELARTTYLHGIRRKLETSDRWPCYAEHTFA